MSKTFTIESLGCRTNQYESQALKRQLKALGFVEARHGEVVELCIINSCSVTHNAQNSSKRRVRSLIKKYPHARVVVTGCIADVDGVRAIEGVSDVFAKKDKFYPAMPFLTAGCFFGLLIAWISTLF